MLSRFFIIVLALVFTAGAFAANLAIVDSGMDYKHTGLKDLLWKNPNPPDIKDADGTNYADVQHGWNFAESNNQVIDYKYLGTFSSDCTKIFEVQAKILTNKATEEEKAWYKAKKEDQTFLKELSKFGNFVHGTHVSGISSEGAPKAHLIAEKLIPTEVPGGFDMEFVKNFVSEHQGMNAGDNLFVKLLLSQLAKRQAELLIKVGKFLAATDAEVANGSFGTSVKAVAPLLKQLLPQLLGEEPSEEDVIAYAKYLIEEITKAAKPFVTSSPDTLYVFAAGNDGTDNDTLPVSPANIKVDNAIVVAATNGTDSLAVFSNFGAKNVEVAAPGVAILSTIPGDAKLVMSGTSMAAPFVTNVAGLVKDANPALTPKEIKTILMQTVDVKDFLKGKVVSGGIVNRARAVAAAKQSRKMSLEKAIAFAKRSVGDFVANARPVNEKDLIVLPLPNLF